MKSLLAGILVACLPPAIAHDTSLSSSRMVLEPDGITLSFTMSLDDLATIVDLSEEKEGILGAKRFEALLPTVLDYVSAHLSLDVNDQTVKPEFVRGVFPDGAAIPLGRGRTPLGLVLRYPWRGGISRISIRCDAFREQVAEAKHLVDFPDGESVVLDRDRPRATWRGVEPRMSQIGRFLFLGVEHILTGWDHLVFLLSLLVAAATFRQVLAFVTAFTVAHSVTLALTVLRILRLPSELVEPLIAASIVYVAIENALAPNLKRRWILTFVFGLVHGMGFGGALLDLNLSRPVAALLGFNVGVELGQLAVVGLVFPALLFLRRHERFYRSYILRGGSLAAASAGGIWFFSRVF